MVHSMFHMIVCEDLYLKGEEHWIRNIFFAMRKKAKPMDAHLMNSRFNCIVYNYVSHSNFKFQIHIHDPLSTLS